MGAFRSAIGAYSLHLMLVTSSSTSSVKIYHNDIKDPDPSTEIHSEFPENILRNFSPKFAKESASKRQLLGDISTQMTDFTITGCKAEAAKAVLAWMLECCQGEGLVVFQTPIMDDESSFRDVINAAGAFGCHILDQKLRERYNTYLYGDVHTHDIRATYTKYPAGHETRLRIADWVATSLFNHYRFPKAVMILRDTLSDFNQDVNDCYEEKRRSLEEKWLVSKRKREQSEEDRQQRAASAIQKPGSKEDRIAKVVDAVERVSVGFPNGRMPYRGPVLDTKSTVRRQNKDNAPADEEVTK